MPLKSFLLTQSAVAGIGNIYADEALHRAGLHPLSPAGSMKPEHCEALVEGIVEALEAALELGGSSIDDYLDARGERGGMQDEFLVHTREGKPCPRCSAGERDGDGVPEIQRIVVGGRSTYFCPACQKRLHIRISYVGKAVACRQCGHRFIARDPSSSPFAMSDSGLALLQRVDDLLEQSQRHKDR